MISNTSARRPVCATQLGQALVEGKAAWVWLFLLGFCFNAIFTCYGYTANAGLGGGLAVKNKLGVLWWEQRFLPYQHRGRRGGGKERTDQKPESQSHKSIYRFEEQLLLFLRPSVRLAKGCAKKKKQNKQCE